jgi:hypothetical protein
MNYKGLVSMQSGEEMVRETCRRCGGSGSYSFNLQDGTMCYGCSGSGNQYTKLSTVKNRIDIEVREESQRVRNCGLTNKDIKTMVTWSERIASERKVLCGYTNSEIQDMLTWSKDRAEKVALAAKQALIDQQQFVGTIKVRSEFDIILYKVITCDGLYGISLMHIMYDLQGNKIMWFNSGAMSGMEIGQQYKIAGTPKAHQEREFRGIWEKSTTLNRVKVI